MVASPWYRAMLLGLILLAFAHAAPISTSSSMVSSATSSTDAVQSSSSSAQDTSTNVNTSSSSSASSTTSTSSVASSTSLVTVSSTSITDVLPTSSTSLSATTQSTTGSAVSGSGSSQAVSATNRVVPTLAQSTSRSSTERASESHSSAAHTTHRAVKTKSAKPERHSTHKTTAKTIRPTRTRGPPSKPVRTTKAKQRTTKARPTTRTTRLRTATPTPKLAVSRSTQSHSTKLHSSKSHSSHSAVPTALVRHDDPHHPKGGGTIVSDPIPGSAWERIRKILLIPLCTMTVLTFLAGVALYIAATWGSGEGWFGRPLPREDEEDKGEKVAIKEKQGQTIGFPQDKKAVPSQEQLQEHKDATNRDTSGEFQFRVPSINETQKQQ